MPKLFLLLFVMGCAPIPPHLLREGNVSIDLRTFPFAANAELIFVGDFTEEALQEFWASPDGLTFERTSVLQQDLNGDAKIESIFEVLVHRTNATSNLIFIADPSHSQILVGVRTLQNKKQSKENQLRIQSIDSTFPTWERWKLPVFIPYLYRDAETKLRDPKVKYNATEDRYKTSVKIDFKGGKWSATDAI